MNLNKKMMINSFLVLVLSLVATVAQAELVGKPAPGFELKNQNGETVTLDKYKDKVVVLEWFNHGCPFVVKHYGSGNIPALQKKYGEKGVVWLSINSTNKDHKDFTDAAKAKAEMTSHKSAAQMVLLDPAGVAGHAYDAKTTPHMFVINKGTVVYEGAIDSIPSTEQADVAKAENYVAEALDVVLAGKDVKEIKNKKTKPYGCGVKYN